MKNKSINTRILRYSPVERKRFDEFEVPYRSGMTVQSLIRNIFEYLDPTLAFRDFRCGKATCGACLIKVNGKVRRACETPIQAGEQVLLEPASNRVIKDLVIQFD